MNLLVLLLTFPLGAALAFGIMRESIPLLVVVAAGYAVEGVLAVRLHLYITAVFCLIVVILMAVGVTAMERRQDSHRPNDKVPPDGW